MARIEKRQQRNVEIGRRLSDCMKLRNMIAADLRRAAESISGEKIPSSYISQVLKGTRGLSTERAILFAKALKIKAGYLLADDDFFAKSYEEYCSDSNLSAVARRLTILLEPTDYYLKGISSVGDVITDYDICSGNKHANVPAKEIDHFLSEIERTIRFFMEGIVDRNLDNDSSEIDMIDNEMKEL